MVKVSIVIPFYNNKDLLMEMVNSVINQQFKDWELLLINDGADKDILYSLQYIAILDKRIKIINRDRQPKGAQTCRNIGLEYAMGEYICFFDSDDIVLPHCLSTRVEFMNENKELDFAVFKAQTYDISRLNTTYIGVKRTSDDIKYFINGILPFAVWTNMYRTDSLVKKKSYWDPNILSLQDSDFNIQNIVVKGMKYDYCAVNEPDYLWRINHNSDSITKKVKSRDHNTSHLYFMRKLILSIRSNFGTKYDEDLSLRVFDFSDKFSDNKDFVSLNLLQQLCSANKLKKPNIMKIKILNVLNNYLKSKIMCKILLFLIFPKQTYKRHINAKKFLKEVE